MELFNKINIIVEDLKITYSDFRKYLNTDEIPELFRDIISNFLLLVRKENISIVYNIYPVYSKKPELNIFTENIILRLGEEAYDFVVKSDYVTAFAATLGNIQDKMNSLAEKYEFTGKYLADITGTILLEKSIDSFYIKISKELNKASLKTGNIINPGNCGWSIKEQEKILKLLPDKLGIELNKSFMMKPIKSSTGIIGVGTEVKFKHSDCLICTSKNCLYRKETNMKTVL